MKLTLAELKTLEKPLSKLLEEKLPLKTSYRMSKVLKQISGELSDLETSRQNLIRNYGEVDEEAKEIAIKDQEKLLAFQKEFTELLQEEIELNFEPISLNDLGNNLELTVADMAYLSVLFKDEE